MGSGKTKERSYGIIPVFIDDGDLEVLLVQHHAGHWGFPKGHAEKGESPIEAASREFEEETGITKYRILPELRFKEKYDVDRNGKTIRKKVRYYVAIVNGRDLHVQDDELQDACWLCLDDAVGRITFDESRLLFREALPAIRKLLQEQTPLD